MKAKIFILSLVIVILFLGQLSPNIYISSMPELTKLFKTSDALIEFSITIAMVTFAISMFLWGPLSDHYGRKIVIIIGEFLNF